jgi:hypothetical protein
VKIPLVVQSLVGNEIVKADEVTLTLVGQCLVKAITAYELNFDETEHTVFIVLIRQKKSNIQNAIITSIAFARNILQRGSYTTQVTCAETSSCGDKKESLLLCSYL